MKDFNRLKRAAAVLAAIAPLAVAATNANAAAPLRSATTTDYTTARFLQATLGLSANDSDPAIEPVTYDHFQWLLQQPGRFAVLIGDPALDPSFAARARDVEAAADAAGVERVYWFDPNLSGSVTVGDVTEPNLDIRDPAGITSLAPASRTVYGNAWLNLVGRYLGNGVSATVTAGEIGGEDTVVTATTRTADVNDAGAAAGRSTKVGDADGGALYDYTDTGADADVSDSYFLVYDKSHTVSGAPQRIVSWVDLTEQADSAAARADVATAIGTVGAANLSAIDQFHWWKDWTNERHHEQTANAAAGKDVPVITDADNADGWRIEQITYPELVHLLKSDANRDAVILFGGTWCPNTRPVLPAIDRYAQQNDVHVFNFDTVLDGANVGGLATSAVNPLQTRNTAAYQATTNANPSFLYGDLLNQYLTNVVTQYDPATSSRVTSYPGGDTSRALVETRKLQVPFLIGYRGSESAAPHAGVTRQWIIDNGGGRYTEYMSSWAYTNPLPNQINLSTIPLDAPIWATINDQIARFTWRTDPATLYPNTGIDSDDADWLVAADTATVSVTSANAVRVVSGGPTVVSPVALSAALAALGPAAPADYAAAKTAWLADQSNANLTTVVGAWGVAQLRKSRVITVWGERTRPSSVAGGVAAVRATEIFFGGLPGAVVSEQQVTADTVKAGTAPTISIAVTNPYGRVATGDVSLVVTRGGATVASGSTALVGEAASFTLPALPEGSYDYALSYAGSDQVIGFTKTGSLTVAPADVVVVTPPVIDTRPPVVDRTPPAVTRPTVKRVKARSLKGAVAKAPTSRKGGTFKVTIAVPKGGAAASGKVTLKLQRGKRTKTIRGTLKKGAVTLKLPKLAKGTWKLTISWPGDRRYLAASKRVTIKVKR